ncbi:alanine racemase [Sinorhizobium sp. 7-81]|uniref:alanine racemase n=1 Tax=Sinorhizobium sp. 8-89 TaxID=3049089 RepID=UPI0024C235A5|nr:alanine racemase [Sinorhizobium sp. 8-89]MDK1492935.1 alanine racemase [Sinorhizobium sp. 8-89]
MTRSQSLAAFSDDARRSLSSGPIMLVDLSAIQRNFRKLAQMTHGTCVAVVKGDGYGHGMCEASRALRNIGADLFFSARFEDALTLRAELGVGPRVAVLDGVSPADTMEARAQNIIPVVNSLEQLHVIFGVAKQSGQRMPAFIHLDTAMNRLGLAPDDDKRAEPLLASCNIQAYMTHFASADDVDVDLCHHQVSRLVKRAKRLPRAPLSIANSCGVFLGREMHGDIIRPGKSTFGINPTADAENPMEEPATILAPVVQIRTLKKGDPVGYSCTWRAPKPRRIAILAIGYANGFMRDNSNKGFVMFGKQRAPVVGRVSMDLTAVDISELPETAVYVGAAAEIVGDNITYRQIAETIGTNEHEAIITLGRGCKRFFVNGDPHA